MKKKKKISQMDLEGLPTQVVSVLEWLQKNGKMLAICVVVFLAVFVGMISYKSYQSSRAIDAANSLSDVGSIEDLQKIVTTYADTPSAPAALMSLGNYYYDNAQYAAARNIFEEFIKTYPKHIMKPSAELALAYCFEAEGNVDIALAQFVAFGTKYPKHYLYAPSVLSIGRCNEQLGKLAEAEQVYNDFIALKPKSPWVPQAETALTYLAMQQRAIETAKNQPAPAPAPLSTTVDSDIIAVSTDEARTVVAEQEPVEAVEAGVEVVDEVVIEAMMDTPTAEEN